MTYPIQILVRKDFPLLDQLNAFIHAISANGLIMKLLAGTRSRSEYQYLEQEFEAVNMDSLKLVFIYWNYLFTLPFLIFIAENVILHIAEKSNQNQSTISNANRFRQIFFVR